MLRTVAAPAVRVQAHDLHIEVVGNTLLGVHSIEAALASARSAADAVSRLEAAYRRAGYLLVGLRAQTAADGKRVRIDVIEGQITAVRATPGVAAFYRGVEFDPTVTENQLIRRNILAEMYASRSGLGFQPSLGPAPQPGGSLLSVQTTPQPGFKPVSGSLTLGNYGSRYVGGDVAAANVQMQPGDGWLFAASYSHGLPNWQKDSAGSRSDSATLSASKVTPWGIYGLSLARSTYRLGVSGAPYYPAGQTQTAALTANQLVWASATTRLALNQALTHVAYKSTVLGGSFTLADQNYNYASVGVQASRNVQLGDLAGSLSAAATYNLGLSAPRGTMIYDLSSAPQTRFHYWTVNATWQQALPNGFSSTLSASGQWGLDTLPANQQWVIGGFGSLTAWNSGILSGDGGYLLRASVQTPAQNLHGWQLTGQLFAEQGAVTTHYNPPKVPGWKMLADVGVGFTVVAPWKTSLTLLAARPAAQKNVGAAVIQSQRAVYFLLQQPF